MTLSPLATLVAQMLLRDRHLTIGALHGARLGHPLLEQVLAPPALPVLPLELLASEALVIRLCATAKTRGLLAQGAFVQARLVTVLELNGKGTVRRRARDKIRGAGDGDAEAQTVQALHDIP